jgi:hypothetical protein
MGVVMDSKEETQWVLQVISADDPGAMSVDWDTFNIGVIEGGKFRTIYACWSQEDADFLLSGLRWYTTFKEGSIGATEPGKAVPKAKPEKTKKIAR